MPRLARILLLVLALALLATSTIDAKKRKSRKRHRATTPIEQVATPTADTVATVSADSTSKWVNTRNGNSFAVLRNMWSDINLSRCIEDYRVVRVQVADSLEANKKADETIRFYETPLYTLTRMMNYQKFKPQGYSTRLTIYFYGAAALFCLMLIVWIVKSFIVSPFKD